MSRDDFIQDKTREIQRKNKIKLKIKIKRGPVTCVSMVGNSHKTQGFAFDDIVVNVENQLYIAINET